ncbi:MAG: ABC transporter ATP-binding protein [Gemmobacter sp.]|nr:ABC transporter ATP-binding protein [Gemmobacter sp.]
MAVTWRKIKPMGQRPEILRMAAVNKVFNGQTVALQGMNLVVNEGDFISLLGPSGCGKSTALRLIAGLMHPTAGQISWQGGQEPGRSGRGVPGTHADALGHRGAECLAALPAARQKLRGGAATQIRRGAETAWGWTAFENAYPRELSGGMKMRVSIARALVTSPRLILMDEPFAALDEITRHKLNNDLLELRAKIGCTVIFVTHSVFESVFLSDRIVVMAARPGRVDRELTVDAPYPRGEDFRTSADYAALCRDASAALHHAMGDAA